jgi:hypothetical protein
MKPVTVASIQYMISKYIVAIATSLKALVSTVVEEVTASFTLIAVFITELT